MSVLDTLIKIILVEDNPGDTFLIKQELKQLGNRQLQVTHFEFLEEAINSLHTNDFDAVLLDLSLPDSQGLDTLLSLEEEAPGLPVIVLTGLDDETIAIKAVRQGAQDYLVKGEFNGQLLIRSIYYAIERKRLEKDLKQRTIELAQVNEELQAFSYTVSHDLRNPLQAINNLHYLLKIKYENQLDEKGKYFLEEVHNNVIRMNLLIEDLLQLSNIQHHKIECLSVDLSKIAKDIISRLQEQEERNLKFITKSDVITQGDPHLLQIALDNLLDNAWKYTGKEEIAQIEFGTCSRPQANQQMMNGESSVSSQVSVRDKRQLVYFVRDNGIGFDMDEADQLFIPFKRLHSLREFRGTGIGLATVERIIKRHGGQIWAESEVNFGTTFYFTLNCQEASSCAVVTA